MIFIDKKVDDLIYNDLYSSVLDLKLKSKVYFTERSVVNWGNYSQIQAEMILFKTAFSRSGYTYYHLISGSDFPLVS